MYSSSEKIKDIDYLFSSAKVRAMESTLVGKEQINAMLDAKTDDDALKVLRDLGYELENGLENGIAIERKKVIKMISSVVPDKRIVDFFRIKYDYHNAKTMIKSLNIKENVEHLYIDSGRVSFTKLKEALQENSMFAIPLEMRKAIFEARDVLARVQDPQLSDIIFDKAMFAEMKKNADDMDSLFVKGYVAIMIDAANLRTLIRAKRLAKNLNFLTKALIHGGHISVKKLASENEDNLAALFNSTVLHPAAIAGVSAIKGETGLSGVDKLCDEAVLKYLSSARYIAFGEQPIMYFLSRQEAGFTTIRTIMAGRMANLAAETIRDRLRNYV